MGSVYFFFFLSGFVNLGFFMADVDVLFVSLLRVFQVPIKLRFLSMMLTTGETYPI